MLVTHRLPVLGRDDGSFRIEQRVVWWARSFRWCNDDIVGRRVVECAAATTATAAVAAGAAIVPGLDLHLLDLDPTLHRMHYDRHFQRLCGSCTTVCSICSPTALRPSPPAGREGYVAVACVRRRRGAAPEGEQVLVHDYHLALVPGMVRAVRSDLRLTHFTHTPFCGPNSIRVLPTDMAEAMCTWAP